MVVSQWLTADNQMNIHFLFIFLCLYLDLGTFLSSYRNDKIPGWIHITKCLISYSSECLDVLEMSHRLRVWGHHNLFIYKIIYFNTSPFVDNEILKSENRLCRGKIKHSFMIGPCDFKNHERVYNSVYWPIYTFISIWIFFSPKERL